MTLEALGMKKAFQMPGADFSGINGKDDLFISAVVHKAFVDVNEEGTEAAAATAVIAAAGGPPPSIPEFRADHPFIFLIRDTRNDSVLFLGASSSRVSDGDSCWVSPRVATRGLNFILGGHTMFAPRQFLIPALALVLIVPAVRAGEPEMLPLQHGGAVVTCAFSPDGKQVATGADKVVRLGSWPPAVRRSKSLWARKSATSPFHRTAADWSPCPPTRTDRFRRGTWRRARSSGSRRWDGGPSPRRPSLPTAGAWPWEATTIRSASSRRRRAG